MERDNYDINAAIDQIKLYEHKIRSIEQKFIDEDKQDIIKVLIEMYEGLRENIADRLKYSGIDVANMPSDDPLTVMINAVLIFRY